MDDSSDEHRGFHLLLLAMSKYADDDDVKEPDVGSRTPGSLHSELRQQMDKVQKAVKDAFEAKKKAQVAKEKYDSAKTAAEEAEEQLERIMLEVEPENMRRAMKVANDVRNKLEKASFAREVLSKGTTRSPWTSEQDQLVCWMQDHKHMIWWVAAKQLNVFDPNHRVATEDTIRQRYKLLKDTGKPTVTRARIRAIIRKTDGLSYNDLEEFLAED